MPAEGVRIVNGVDGVNDHSPAQSDNNTHPDSASLQERAVLNVFLSTANY
jgi:hypothetical protein